MFSVLGRSDVRRIAMRNFKICGLLKTSYPQLQAVLTSASDPCAKVDPCPCGSSQGSGKGGGSSKHQISFKPYQPPPCLQHDYKNMALNRPMSPHLTIYAPTLPAMTSIVQRITGVIVVFYAIMLAAGALVLPRGVESYVSMIQSLNLGAMTVLLIKIIMGAPFVYHYFNGIRFCMWNAGKWLAMKDVYESAKKSFILTGIFTIIFSLL